MLLVTVLVVGVLLEPGVPVGVCAGVGVQVGLLLSFSSPFLAASPLFW